MTNATNTSRPVPLSLIGIWRASFRALWAHRWLAIGLAVANQVAASLLYGLYYALEAWIAALPPPADKLAGMALVTAALALYAILALAWMRVCLLGSHLLRGHLGVPIDRTTAGIVNAVLVGFTLIVILGVTIYVTAFHARWFPAAAMLVVAVLLAPPLLARWSLVLPALAAGHHTTVRLALAQSRGNGLRLAILLFVGLAFFAAGAVLADVAYDLVIAGLETSVDALRAEIADALLFGTLSLVLTCPPMLLTAGSLAYAYRVLSDHPDPLAVPD